MVTGWSPTRPHQKNECTGGLHTLGKSTKREQVPKNSLLQNGWVQQCSAQLSVGGGQADSTHHPPAPARVISSLQRADRSRSRGGHTPPGPPPSPGHSQAHTPARRENRAAWPPRALGMLSALSTPSSPPQRAGASKAQHYRSFHRRRPVLFAHSAASSSHKEAHGPVAQRLGGARVVGQVAVAVGEGQEVQHLQNSLE